MTGLTLLHGESNVSGDEGKTGAGSQSESDALMTASTLEHNPLGRDSCDVTRV